MDAAVSVAGIHIHEDVVTAVLALSEVGKLLYPVIASSIGIFLGEDAFCKADEATTCSWTCCT